MKTWFFLSVLVAFGMVFLGGTPFRAEATPDQGCQQLFFSEYVEGSSYNKALEIYNPSDHTIDLNDYRVLVSFNGTTEKSVVLTGTVAAGDVFLLAHSRADPAILAQADMTNDVVVNFNGNDAVALYYQDELIDLIGHLGEDPGDAWGSEPVTTRDHTLRRKPEVTVGDADGSDPFDPAATWDGYPKNTFSGLGTHTSQCQTSTPPVAIHDIQAAAHLSPYRGMTVADVPGIVTAVASRGFYMQTPDADVDDDDATSEGIYVYTRQTPTVQVGDLVLVSGLVSEYYPYPGANDSANLSTTEITLDTVTVVAQQQPLPQPIVIGLTGRMPPTTIIEDDADGSVNYSGVFDPDEDGLDFYESLEGMRVQVNNALVLGPTSRYGEIPVIGDGGQWGGVFSQRGALVVRPDDANPERLLIDDTLVKDEPKVSLGARFDGAVIGVMDYTYGNFKLFNTQPLPDVIPSPLQEETAAPAEHSGVLSIATMNVENLDPGDSDAKFQGLARDIVQHLLAPDIISLSEIQDNDGKEDDGVVDASETYARLIAAIQAAGGPLYAYRDIAPLNDEDGGQPGGNIRVGFLFRPDRVHFVDRAGGDAITPVRVISGELGPELSMSPGRVEPQHVAWEHSRKPLAGEFTFNGHTLFVIANHFCSKGGDDPLFGRYQPPKAPSADQRLLQARVVQGFVADILQIDPYADVVVLGDFNDFWFSDAVRALEANGLLTNLVERLPEEERYTYLYQGNGQAIDHILVSTDLLDRNPQVDIVHANAGFVSLPERATDHDPVLARFDFGPYLVYRNWLPGVWMGQ